MNTNTLRFVQAPNFNNKVVKVKAPRKNYRTYVIDPDLWINIDGTISKKKDHLQWDYK